MAEFISVIHFCLMHLLMCSYVLSIDIDFDDSKDGFFLKSPYHKFKPAEPSVVKESLILTHPAEVYKLRASYGPFEMYQVVPNEFLSSSLSYGDPLDTSEIRLHRQIIHNMDVSAHLVKQSISESNPIVQVLVHAQPLKQNLIYSYYGDSQWWCAQIFVTRGVEELTSVCLLNEHSNACVAGVTLPDNWWTTSNNNNNSSYTKDDIIKVYYDISHAQQNQECASVSNAILPSRPETRKPVSERKFISSVDLIRVQKSYKEQKDKDLIFQIPLLELHSSSKFEVPVRLEKNSTLKEFVIKVKVRGPLLIEGASTSIDSPWNVFFEAGDKAGVATVTAFLKDELPVNTRRNGNEVMRWQFGVSKDRNQLLVGTARVVWTVDYEKDIASQGSSYLDGNKVVAKFNILHYPAETIIPVLKEQSLLNTAVLTGKLQKHDLQVYSVRNDNTFERLTKSITCHSTDAEALKVSVTCDSVYLDGSETRGAKNVTVVVRTPNHQAYIGVRVWVPEPTLDIQFSDSKLSHIKGWKVKKSSSHNSRRKRSIDLGLLTHPGNLFGRDNVNRDLDAAGHHQSFQQSCRYKYQQSLVDVYARFFISVPGEAPRFYRNKKTYVRVTDLVKDRLQTANPYVARMSDYTVQGIAPGKTDVQVVSPTGKLLGAREIRVGKDKVEIERLMVRVISGMGLHISEDRNLPGALMATVYLRDQFVARQQEAVLDIALEFKDGTTMPLSKVDPTEYSLKVSSISPGVVEVVKSDSPSAPSVPPTIRAVGNGKGDIVKVVLKETSGCHKRKAKTLDTEYVHVMVDFAKGGYFGQPQSDGSNNQPEQGGNYRSHHHQSYANKEEYFKHQEELNHKQQQQLLMKRRLENGKDGKFGHKVYDLKDVFDKYDSISDTDPSSVEANTIEPRKDDETVGKPVNTKADGLSPLEIGMYVLVSVFIFAIFVFTANCAVFMMRYRRKRRGSSSAKKASHVVKGSISQAPDWVWIGRDTLEKNGARHTGCNQPLMAEEDFNGNQMVIPNSTTAPSMISSSNSCKKNRISTASEGGRSSNSGSSSSSGIPKSSSSSRAPAGSASNRNSMTSTYEGSECSVRITSNPLLPDNDSGMGYNEAEWDYEAMGMTYEQLMEYFDNLKESCA